MRTLCTLLIFSQAACIASSYRPADRGTAKLTHVGRNATLMVGAREESISAWDDDYIELLDEQARPVAQEGQTHRIAGTTLAFVGLAGTVASFFILPDAGDLVDLDSNRGKVAFGVLLGSALISAIGGYFASSADVKLNDAINIHNDRFADRLAQPPAAALLPPASMRAETPVPTGEPAPSPARAPTPTPAAEPPPPETSEPTPAQLPTAP